MENRYVFGVDIGGTSVKIGLFSPEGKLIEKWGISTDKTNSGVNILPNIAEALKNKMAERGILATHVLGIGVGAPGPVDKHGVVHGCVNIGWGETNVAKSLEKLSGMKTLVGNDANVAALGETRFGSGKGFESVVLVTLGTGVGGGIIQGGNILIGEHGSAGEIGHITVDINEKTPCSCGKRGCLEQYASASGMAHQAEKLIKAGMKTTLGEISAKAIICGAKEGDALCIEVVEKMGRALGLGLSNVAVTCDPGAFVIGGGVSKAGDFLLGFIKKYYNEYSFHAVRDTSFKIASLGNDAGIFGAASLII